MHRMARARVDRPAAALSIALVALVGCAEGGGRMFPDGGPGVDAAAADAGGRDAGPGRVDAGPGAADAGPGAVDAGHPDAGPGATDAGRPDAGDPARRDAGPPGGPCTITPGMLVIVEVMIASTTGSTDRGEWFEITNTGACTASLAGLTIQSPTGGGARREHTMTAGTIAPGQRFVLAQDGDAVANHGLAHDYVYGTGRSSDEVVLNNEADSLTLELDGVIIDQVAWPSTGFERSFARQYPEDRPKALNEDWASWCDATMVYSSMGGTFYGTPRAPNDGTCR